MNGNSTTVTIRSLAEMEVFTQDFVASVSNKPTQSGATVVALKGDLGAGKTAFVKAVAKALGIEETVTSPTFVIEKIYKLGKTSPNSQQSPSFEHLIHIDAYRLEGGQELKKLGWQETVSNPKNIIFIEWPEKVADIIPVDAIKLSFTFVDDTTRTIERV